LLGQRRGFNDQLNDTSKRFTYFAPIDYAWKDAANNYPSTTKKLFMPEYSYHVSKLLKCTLYLKLLFAEIIPVVRTAHFLIFLSSWIFKFLNCTFSLLSLSSVDDLKFIFLLFFESVRSSYIQADLDVRPTIKLYIIRLQTKQILERHLVIADQAYTMAKLKEEQRYSLSSSG